MSVSQQIKLEHDRYIDKICNSKKLRRFAKEFFVELCNYYDGQDFTKDNFETLVIDGKETQQDIVTFLFKDNKQVSAGEIYLYLLKNNIKKISFVNEISFKSSNIAGSINAIDKIIKIKDIPLKDFYGDLTIHQKKSLSEENKKKWAIKEQSKQIKYNFFHELAHIFEIKTFKNRLYLKNSMSDRVLCLDQSRTETISYVNSYNITKQLIEKNKSRYDDSYNPINKLNNLKALGLNSISEVFNEILKQKITNTLSLSDNSDEYNLCDGDFSNKFVADGTSSYLLDFDIAQLIMLALGDFDEKNFRFNPKAVFEKLNNLNISKDFLKSCQEEFFYLFKKSAKLGYEQMHEEMCELISNSDIVTTIAVIMAKADSSSFKNDYKVALQALLIESIKNDIVEKLKNDKIKKDEKFFLGINSTLEKIDQIFCYPVDIIGFLFPSGDPQIPEEYAETNITLYSVRKYHEKYPEYIHLRTFDNLVRIVQKSILENKDKISNLKEIMTFFKTQKDIEQKYQKLIKKEKYAVALMKIDRNQKEKDFEQ